MSNQSEETTTSTQFLPPQVEILQSQEQKFMSLFRPTRKPRPIPTDRLSTVPPEVLSMIFSELRLSSEAQMTGFISHTLLPFMRKNLYRTIVIESAPKLHLLIRTVLSGEDSIGSLVFALDIDLEPEEVEESVEGCTTDEEEEEQDNLKRKEEESEEGLPSVESLKDLLSALPNLKFLSLSDDLAERVTYHVSSKAYAQHSLKHLRLLSLEFNNWTEGLDYSNFVSLSHLSTLKFLFIRYCKSHMFSFSPMHRSINVPLAALPQNHSITYLHLLGQVSAFSIKEFLSNFPSLQALHLDAMIEFDFPQALFKVAPALSHLHVTLLGSVESEVTRPIDTVLNTFPNLDQLTLGRKTFSAGVYKALSESTTIKNLTFAGGAAFFFDGVRQLIHGSQRMKTLETLTLNILPYSIGKPPDSSNVTPSITLEDLGWVAPVWPPECSQEEAKLLQNLVANTGIKLGGTIFEAYEWEERYEEAALLLQALKEAKEIAGEE